MIQQFEQKVDRLSFSPASGQHARLAELIL